MVDRDIDDYCWFDIKVNRYNNRGWNIEWNDDWDDSHNWTSGVEYTMTNDGLKRTERVSGTDQDDHPKNSKKEKEGYRYKGNADSKDSTGNKLKSGEKKTKNSSDDNSDDDDNKETLVTPLNNRLEAMVSGASPLILSVLFQ